MKFREHKGNIVDSSYTKSAFDKWQLILAIYSRAGEISMLHR